MRRWLPLALLAGFGLLMGVVPPLAKLGAEAGLSAPTFAFGQALGAGLAILALCLARRTPPALSRRHLRYYAVAGLTGIALPNLLVYLVVPRLGAGLASLAYAFPPLFTLGLAMAFRMERFQPRRAAGLLLGFLGTAMIALPEGGLPQAAGAGWLLLALAAPLSLAVGNIYRSRDWPPGAEPLPLAAGMLLAGAVELIPALAMDGAVLPPGAAATPLLAAMAVSAVAYMLFLELQRVAGPVYLSQVGYVMTPTGLAVGVTVLGEVYSAWVWAAVAVVFLGVALTNWSRSHPAAPQV